MTGKKQEWTGVERRENPMACSSICPPIVIELKEVYKSIQSKTSSKLFYWIVGGLAFFVVIVVGGAQWKMAADISSINTNVEVVRQTVNGLATNVQYHITIDDARHLRNEDKIEKNKDELQKLYKDRNRWERHP